MAPYPTRDEIEEIFSTRDVPELFHSHIAEHIDVSVPGQEDFHLSGHYKSIDAFHEAIYARVAAALKPETIVCVVNRVIGGGDSSWAAVHSYTFATCKNGNPHRMEFVDLVRFNSDKKIAQMIEFFDTKQLHGHVEDHESSQSKEKKTDGS